MMGFKSLFKKKKQQQQQGNLPMETAAAAAETFIKSRSPSVRINEELEHVFRKFDANGDGKICAAELGAIMRSLGHPVTEEEVRIMIREVDADGDGFIDLQEFIELNTSNVDHEEVLENLKHAFAVFDIDKNGTISAEELLNVLRSLGEECTLDDCRKMIGGVDIDGSGTIDFDEFKVMMTKGASHTHTHNLD